jgi:hypothetical protein
VTASRRAGPRSPARALLAVLLLALLALNACAEAEPAGKPRTLEPERATTLAVASASPPAASCGKSGLPDCPLQAWMKANLQAQLLAGDTERLAEGLETLAAHEPAGFSGWADSARTAARAARAGDLEKTRAECKHCHVELRSRFRAELRTARLF